MDHGNPNWSSTTKAEFRRLGNDRRVFRLCAGTTLGLVALSALGHLRPQYLTSILDGAAGLAVLFLFLGWQSIRVGRS